MLGSRIFCWIPLQTPLSNLRGQLKNLFTGTTWIDRCLEFLWLAAIFLVPLIFLPNIETTFELAKVVIFRVMVLLMAMLWAAKILTTERVKIATLKTHDTALFGKRENFMKRRGLMLCLAFFVWWYLVATILSVAPNLSVWGWYPRFQGLFTFGCYVLFGAVLFFNFKGGKQLERLMTAIFCSTAISAFLAILQRFHVQLFDLWDVSDFLGRVFGTMGDPNTLGVFLAMIIPLMIVRLLQTKNVISAMFGLSFALPALSFTFSRAGFLGLFAGLFLMLLIGAKKLGKRRLFMAAVWLPVLAIGVLVLVNMFKGSDFVRSQALLYRLTFQEENWRSLETRLNLWPATARQIMDSPIIGYGPETFAVTFPAYVPARLNFTEKLGDIFDHPHNELLDWAVQIGLPGMLAYVGFWVLLFIAVIRRIMAEGRKDLWLFHTGVLGGVFALLIANQFGFMVTILNVYLVMLVVLLLRFLVMEERVVPLKLRYSVKLAIFVAACAVGVWLMLFHNFNLLLADYSYRHGEHASAVELAPSEPQYVLALGMSILQKINDGEALSYADLATIRGKLQQASKLRGYDAFSLFTKAQVEALLGKTFHFSYWQPALTDFAFAAKKAPHYAPIYLEWGKALLANKKYSGAVEAFEKYLGMVPEYYKWASDLASRSAQEQNEYRLFYKHHPDFNEVLMYLKRARSNSAASP